jgi:hypothetical protein
MENPAAVSLLHLPPAPEIYRQLKIINYAKR